MTTYIKRKSKKQEDRTAKEFSAVRNRSSVQIASGAIDGMKGDARTGENTTGFNTEDFLIENKFTDDAKYSFKLATWEKIEKEALRDNMRIPLMQIDIQDSVQLVVIQMDDMQSLGKFPFSPFVSTVIDKAKSYPMKVNTYEEMLTLHGFVFQALVFMKARKTLFVVSKSDFLRFLAQNID